MASRFTGNFYNVAGGLNIECPPPCPSQDPAHSAGCRRWGLEGTTAPNLMSPTPTMRSERPRQSAEPSLQQSGPSGRQQIAWNPPNLQGFRGLDFSANKRCWITGERNTNHHVKPTKIPSSSGTLISADKPRAVKFLLGAPTLLLRNTYREGIPRHPIGIDSVVDPRFGSASLLRVECNSTKPQGVHEANAFTAIQGPENQVFECVPFRRDFAPPAEPGRTQPLVEHS
ncbi:hypothetical protein K438DRAFT_1771143, partial [Mycena galopus ATCC 62051]